MNQYQPGYIIEIRTDWGIAYVHMARHHESYPQVIRLLARLHEARPDDLAVLAACEVRLTAMIPLDTALAGLGLRQEKAGEAKLPLVERCFPTLRMPIRNRQGQVVYWWLWDGQGLSHASELSQTQKTLPLREVIFSERFLDELRRAA